MSDDGDQGGEINAGFRSGDWGSPRLAMNALVACALLSPSL